MGTNYYWRPNSQACKECGHDPSEEIHIGKSSAGWCFALHVTDEIEELIDWRGVWRNGGGKIFDEYGREITASDMLVVITQRAARDDTPHSAKWLEVNSAVPGPNGLARAKLIPPCPALTG